MDPVIRSAQFRVYLPVERLGRFDPHRREGRAVVQVDDEFVWEEPTRDDAYTATWSGGTYVCPRYPRLRMLEGVLAFRSAHPASALMSELAVRNAAQELAQIRSDAPTARSYILTAPWHVPLRWFTAFDPAERELYETAAGTSIRYRTSTSDAITRIERAIEILDEAGFDASIVDEVQNLHRWVKEFAGDGMIELDYHTVAGLFPDAELAFDESAAEVARSLSALDRLDYDEANEAYAEVATRWAAAQALVYVN